MIVFLPSHVRLIITKDNVQSVYADTKDQRNLSKKSHINSDSTKFKQDKSNEC